MPRIERVDVGNEVYHVINRANVLSNIFQYQLKIKDILLHLIYENLKDNKSR